MRTVLRTEYYQHGEKELNRVPKTADQCGVMKGGFKKKSSRRLKGMSVPMAATDTETRDLCDRSRSGNVLSSVGLRLSHLSLSD